MNDEAESSGTAQRHVDGPPELADHEGSATAYVDEEELQRLKDQLAKERRLDAKRKRIRMLNELLRELDLVVYMELITVYHLEYDIVFTVPKAATDMQMIAARFSGLLSAPSSTAACSRPCPTPLANVHPTNPSPFCP
jgi:hypothetical protein